MRYFFHVVLLLLSGSAFAYQGLEVSDTTVRPFILGEVHSLYSKHTMENRTLNIYLPSGYSTDSAGYPVIYLLDGSADEDFIHVVGLVQFLNFPWVDQMPPSIVVGIGNTNRLRDFTFPLTDAEDRSAYPQSGGSSAFIDFLEQEVKPYIYSRFNTSDESTLIGQSLGGLLAATILEQNPALFNRYIIISPSLWWNNGSLLNQSFTRLASTQQSPVAIYIGVGKEGLTPGRFPRVMEVDANILAEKLTALNNKRLKIIFDYLPGENHATITHQSVFNAFRALFQK